MSTYPITILFPLILLLRSSISTVDQPESQQYIQTSVMQTSQPTINPPTVKGKRSGRWTQAESTLFEELIQKFGKNWKKIHSYIRGRTLCQIRSHAQKFFERIGPARTREFQRKAKILQAIETLEHEKLLQKASAASRAKQEKKFLQPIVKQEENSIPTRPQISVPSGIQNRSGELRQYIKEQFEQSDDRRMQAPLISEPMVHSPIAEQTSECIYAPFYWYANAYAMGGLGNGGNPYNQGYM